MFGSERRCEEVIHQTSLASLVLPALSRANAHLNAAAHNQFALIDRRVASLALVAKTAPLLGLLGTVLGILEIFYTMGESSSYVSASELSMGIYNALLSSAFGLLIAIVAWLAYSFINNRVRALAHDIDWASNEILLFIERGMPENENLHMEGDK